MWHWSLRTIEMFSGINRKPSGPKYKPCKVDAGEVYVIRDESGRRKIGFSKQIEQRLKELQTGNSETLFIEYRLAVRHLKRAEKAIHSLFPANRLSGEWFLIKDGSPEHVLLKKVFNAEPTTRREHYFLYSLGLRE